MIPFNEFELESPNLHQICSLGFSQLLLKIEVTDLDLQGYLAIIPIQETAFNVALVYWSMVAKGCYTSQMCSCMNDPMVCFFQQYILTHLGWNKMATILQTTFSNAFSCMKWYEFQLRFHWSLFPRVQLNNIPALVQTMAWCPPGNKPLSEPLMVSLLTHICVSRPQLVKLPYWSMRYDICIHWHL